MKYASYLIFFCLFALQAHGQHRQIKFVKARTMEYDRAIAIDAQRALGDVVFEHEGSYLYCDSAWFYTNRNSIDAFGTVHIKVSDTLDIYADKLSYNGDLKIAELIDNVKLVDKQTVLTTNRLLYDRKVDIASYHEHAKIVDKENTLTSIKGYYYTRDKNFFFKDSVVLLNPQYTIYSDTLMFNTASEIAYFYGPTDIISKENSIYCESGWYNTRTDLSSFSMDAHIKNKNQYLAADSFYYDRTHNFGKAYDRVLIFDSIQNVFFTGNYSEYYGQNGISFITDSARAVMVNKSDSLFLHADILTVTFDSNRVTQNMFAYNHVRFYSMDMQGLCDSLVYRARDTLILLYKNPVIWSDSNQLSADTISIAFHQQMLDKLKLFSSSFVISIEDSVQFNQMKGKNMVGYFQQNKLYKINVLGNSESLYFAKEDNGAPIGINKSTAINMSILLTGNKIRSISFLDHPEATLYMPKELSAKELHLKNFNWRIHLRPRNKTDIFRVTDLD